MLTSLGALALGGAANAGNGGVLPLSPHSPNAHAIGDITLFVLVVAGSALLIIEGLLVAIVLRYRRGARARTADGPQIRGAGRLSIASAVVPVVILAGIATYAITRLPDVTDAPATGAAAQTTITVEGRQFYWLFRYPNGAVSVGTMIAPAGEVVVEKVVSADGDVAHGWFVPALGGRTDAIPGRTNTTWFKAPTGSYVARCTELCGIQHAKMSARIHVVPRVAYEAFIARRLSEASGVALGKEEFDNVCATCHRMDSTFVGPALGANPALMTRGNLTKILREGIGQMPASGSDWTDDQLAALSAYTDTLKGVRG
ncbi:MAG: c-type cytochrome [Actinomycetes bacterium]